MEFYIINIYLPRIHVQNHTLYLSTVRSIAEFLVSEVLTVKASRMLSSARLNNPFRLALFVKKASSNLTP